MTACALDGLAASAAAAAAALNASRRGTSSWVHHQSVSRVHRCVWHAQPCRRRAMQCGTQPLATYSVQRCPTRAIESSHACAHSTQDEAVHDEQPSAVQMLAGLVTDIMQLPPALHDAWAGL